MPHLNLNTLFDFQLNRKWINDFLIAFFFPSFSLWFHFRLSSFCLLSTEWQSSNDWALLLFKKFPLIKQQFSLFNWMLCPVFNYEQNELNTYAFVETWLFEYEVEHSFWMQKKLINSSYYKKKTHKTLFLSVYNLCVRFFFFFKSLT